MNTEKDTITVAVSRDMKRELRIAAANKNVSPSELVRRAIEIVIRGNGNAATVQR